MGVGGRYQPILARKSALVRNATDDVNDWRGYIAWVLQASGRCAIRILVEAAAPMVGG